MTARVITAAATLLLGLGLAGCSASTSSSDAGGDVEKFTQTWAKSYGETTCADWNHEMVEKQKFVAAADMLSSMQSKDGGTELPADATITSFQGDIDESCSADLATNTSLSEIGATLYLTAQDQYAP